MTCAAMQVSLLRAKFSDLLRDMPAASQLDILSIDGFQVHPARLFPGKG